MNESEYDQVKEQIRILYKMRKDEVITQEEFLRLGRATLLKEETPAESDLPSQGNAHGAGPH